MKNITLIVRATLYLRECVCCFEFIEFTVRTQGTNGKF